MILNKFKKTILAAHYRKEGGKESELKIVQPAIT